MNLFGQICLVALGSTLGGLTRWGVSLACAHWFGRAFPWGTFFINVTGCLFLGWLVTWVRGRVALYEDWTEPAKAIELTLAVGFAGAYTTFSTFGVETQHLLEADRWLAAATYVAASVFVGLLAVRAGMFLARLS